MNQQLRSGPAAHPTLRELLPQHLPQIENCVRRNLTRALRDRESASDLVDSVCVDLLADGVPFEYRSEGQFQSWLRMVVINKIKGRLRVLGAQKRREAAPTAASASQLEAAQIDRGSPLQQAELHEEMSLLDRALARLPAHYRDVIVRTHLRGERSEQVAAALGRTVQATRSLLTRALVRLAGELDRLQNGR
jgi:RNA polymerase sigma factor (sigma-70 family)